MSNLETKYPHLTEFMDKSLYQEAAPTMEEAIVAYAANGQEVLKRLLDDIDSALGEPASEEEMLSYLENHSDYLEPEGAFATLRLFKSILSQPS